MPKKDIMQTITEHMRSEINKAERAKSKWIKVRHLEGSADWVSPVGNSWKAYWEKAVEHDGTYRKFPDKEENCPCCGELTKPEDFVGGHVVSVDDPTKVYICPVSHSCNSKYGEGKEKSPEFAVREWDCVLAPSNR